MPSSKLGLGGKNVNITLHNQSAPFLKIRLFSENSKFSTGYFFSNLAATT